MRRRILTFLIIVALGAAVGWKILQTSQAAAIIFGLAMLLLALTVFFSTRSKTARSNTRSGSKMPPHAVALRQTRAMTRAEDGEISGLPRGPI